MPWTQGAGECSGQWVWLHSHPAQCIPGDQPCARNQILVSTRSRPGEPRGGVTGGEAGPDFCGGGGMWSAWGRERGQLKGSRMGLSWAPQEAQLWRRKPGLPLTLCPTDSLRILFSLSQTSPQSISYLVTKGASTESSREIPMSTLPRK